MEQILDFFSNNIAILIASSTAFGGVLSLLTGFLFTTFLSNSKIKNYGIKHGEKLSRYLRKKFGVDSGESIEKNFVGGFFTYFSGIKEGAERDNKNNNKKISK